MQRYFAKEKINDYFTLLDEDLYHIKKVMRMKDNDNIEVIYDNKLYLCNLKNERDSILINILEEINIKTSFEPEITLIIPFLKEPKMDLIFQKGTELGVNRFIIIDTERSIIKIDSNKENAKLDRWSRICKEASEQSHRLNIPSVEIQREKTELENLTGLKLICSTTEKEKTIKNILKNNKNYDKINMMIGPEGGFSLKEEIYFEKKGFIKISLGTRIMRVETVPIFLSSIISYEYME
jgi:RNA methyltransferase, RsmE family